MKTPTPPEINKAILLTKGVDCSSCKARVPWLWARCITSDGCTNLCERLQAALGALREVGVEVN